MDNTVSKATKKRETWKNGKEFMFSCIGVSVGLGNIWRFPYICYKNGGGAFLIPYFLFMAILAIPQQILQFSYPQFSSMGPAKAWVCCPLFKAWILYYFGSCFTAHLPWTSCSNAWNTENCYSRVLPYNTTTTNTSLTSHNVSSLTGIVPHSTAKTATEEFWQYKVLELTDNIEDMGQIRWTLLLCNVAVSTIVFFCVFRGIKMSGKIMYVAASIPYIFLTILLIRGLTLEGAGQGLRYYFIPRWEELLNLSVWSDAAVQVIYSAGFAAADLVTLSSYNDFHHNLYRDAMIIPLVDAFTSLFAGCVIFVTLGYMATTFNVDIQDVVADGPGIAFMIFPEAISTLPIPQLWSALFFFTLFTVGLDSRIVHLQVVNGALADVYPHVFRSKVKMTSAAVCILTTIIGIPYVYQGGMFVVQLVDWYIASVGSLLIILLESSVLAWIYGSERLSKDIELMVGYPIPRFWQFFWKFITPITTFFIWVVSLVKHRPVTYGAMSYPVWSIGVGWIIAITPLLPLAVNMIYTLAKHPGGLMQRLRESVKPLPNWTKNMDEDLQTRDSDRHAMLL
ncbi:sodium- and chloride-dependent glycine transporter 1-like isoform X2 [Mizuhopecten yessoensis]|uniref:sodium- and chloride-dependent glycine transporter 1-like isoform X2 n=1 Tax=Mizuhopecten yessoensis TaxID=6573 RepID=UPI000B45EAC7|nr:sodium- and chloride-dependent glycine transporter 1-like isoform X2 [Mizuhopecten yessoensis]